MVPPDMTFHLPKLLRQLLTRLLTRAADAGLVLSGDAPLVAGDVQQWFFGASMRVLLVRGSSLTSTPPTLCSSKPSAWSVS
jgi:hypothetical protein